MKKSKLTRVSAALIAAACLLSLGACGRKNDENNTDNISGGTPENDTVVMTLGDEPVTYEEYRYFYLNTKRDMDGGSETYWDDNTDAEASLKASTLTSLSQYHAVTAAAKALGVELTDEMKSDTEEIIKSYNEAYGEETFKSMLDESYLTLDLFKDIYNVTSLESSVYDAAVADPSILDTNEESIKKALNGDDYIRVMHILYSDRETAEGLLEKAKNATDEEFYQLAQDAEDGGMIGNEAGYCFTYGAMIKEFEEASFALKVGETSDIVESAYGYHIIRRLEKSPEYIDEHYDELSESFLQSAFYEYLDKYAKELEEGAKFGDVYEQLTIANVA